MATIVARKRAGGVRYTAQIRIKRGGQTVYTESETFDKKAMAREWAARREQELKQPGALEKLRHRGLTLGQVLEYYRDDFDGLSKFGRSKLSSINFLMNYSTLADLDAIELTSGQLVDHARRRRQGGTGPATVYNDFIWLRSALRSAQVVRALPVSMEPIENAFYICKREGLVAESERRERRPTRPEMTSIVEWYSEDRRKQKLPMRDLVLFAMFSSRRQDEICRIRWDDLDLERGRVLVRNMKHPRLKVDTWVDLTEQALAVIRRQPRVEGEERIFPCNPRSVGSSFERACKMLGIVDLNFHDLRHECASWLFERGLDIPRVARVTGHRSWATLQRYTHLQEGGTLNRWESWEWYPKADHDALP